jgi:hypothetical protein
MEKEKLYAAKNSIFEKAWSYFQERQIAGIDSKVREEIIFHLSEIVEEAIETAFFIRELDKLTDDEIKFKLASSIIHYEYHTGQLVIISDNVLEEDLSDEDE